MLENINIINYKCFKDFQLDSIKRINIISGGNNVGKTVLLEAFIFDRTSYLFIDEFVFLHSTLNTISYNRDVINRNFLKYLETIDFMSISNDIDLSIKSKTRRELSDFEFESIHKSELKNNQFIVVHKAEKVIVFATDTLNQMHDVLLPNYVNSSKPNKELLVNLYSYIQEKNIQQKFLQYVKILDKNISLIEPMIIDDEMTLHITMNNKLYKSSDLGEGLSRYIEILVALLGNEGGAVYIDEIENGIHYSKLCEIAKAIIEIAQKEDIQVFITTHDKETIEAFAKASEELSFKDISSIELYKDDENIIHPIVMDYDNIIDGIEMGEDFR